MKYFTPERYLAFGNHDDEQTVLAAHKRWEDASAAYAEHLDRIKDKLPRALRRLITSVYLHDARVLSMAQDKWFTVTLQPMSDPQRLVVLNYDLVEEPEIRPDVLPSEGCREPVEWLYDELDLDRPEGPRGLPAPTTGKPTFRHDILLSNGWEVRLRFRAAGAHRPLRVIPACSERDRQPVLSKSV
jgi:hypothetical protein